jgi:hypothetical protein
VILEDSKPGTAFTRSENALLLELVNAKGTCWKKLSSLWYYSCKKEILTRGGLEAITDPESKFYGRTKDQLENIYKYLKKASS